MFLITIATAMKSIIIIVINIMFLVVITKAIFSNTCRIIYIIHFLYLANCYRCGMLLRCISDTHI